MLRMAAHFLGLTNAAKFEKLVLKDRIANTKEFENADSILNAFHAGGGIEWPEASLQPYKLVNLRRRLNNLMPESVLELGSGSSTVILAQWAKANGKKVVSVDESEHWIENTKKIMAQFGVADHVEILYRRKHLDETKKEAWYELGPIEGDLVIIDGPALEKNGVSHKDVVCTDIFSLKNAKHILVDMRLPTVVAMRERMQEYDVCLSDRLNNNIRSKFKYFTEFHKI